MARRFGRRRGRRQTWFPPLGSNFTIGDTVRTTGLVTFQVPVLNTGDISTTDIPLTFDFGEEAFLADAAAGQIRSLADLLNSGWRCRRVVGKIFAAFQVKNGGNLDPTQVNYGACAFSAGIMVRKVDAFTQPAIQTVSTLERDDYTDPWAWRRSWVLGQGADIRRSQFVRSDNSIVNVFTNFPATGTGGPLGTDEFTAFTHFPSTTAGYGSVLDGGHIDCKTNRIIGPEDRLFINLAAKGLPIQPDAQLQEPNSSVIGVFDLRLLGSTMRATNRRNASR